MTFELPLPEILKWHFFSAAHVFVTRVMRLPNPIFQKNEGLQPYKPLDLCAAEFFVNVSPKLLNSTKRRRSKWVFPKIVAFPPKSSILIEVLHDFHHPFWGTIIFGNTQILLTLHRPKITSSTARLNHLFDGFGGTWMGRMGNLVAQR